MSFERKREGRGPTPPQLEGPKPPTRVEQIRAAAVELKQAASFAEHALRDLHAAHDANDPEHWHECRDRAERAVQEIERSRERALAIGEPSLQPDIDAAHARISSFHFGVAPTGITPISREEQIDAAFEASQEGGIAIAFARLEAALRAEIANLDAVDRRTLLNRITRRRPGDKLADKFHRLVPERLERLVEGLRSGRNVSAGAKNSAAPRHAAAPNHVVDVHAAIRSALEDDATEEAIGELFGNLDTYARRDLSERLGGYRQGSGDELAARFSRRDRSVQLRLLAILDGRVPAPRSTRPEGTADPTNSTGTELPPPLLRQLETHTGVNLSGVRVHTGASSQTRADELGARAYTVGQDIHFGTGTYDPASDAGQHLIAHEVAHTIQQREGAPRLQRKTATGAPADHAEVEADKVADTAASSKLELPGDIPFAIAPDRWSVRIRSSWLERDPVGHLTEVLEQMQRLGAFAWATPADLRRAAETTRIASKEPVVEYAIAARTLAQMGLPPRASTIVAREHDQLVVEIRVPGVKEGAERLILGPDGTTVEKAVEKFTGLPVIKHERLEGEAVRAGILEVRISDATATMMFGEKAWKAWKNRRASSNDGADDRPLETTSDLTFSENAYLAGWLTKYPEIASGFRADRSVLDDIYEIEKNPKLEPLIHKLFRKNQDKPGHTISSFDLKDVLRAAKDELERQRLGLTGTSDADELDPSAKAWSIAGRIAQKGLAFADRAMDFTIELDWDLWKTGRSTDEQWEAKWRDMHAEVEWAVERTDKPGKPVTAKHTHDSSRDMSLSHTFQLGSEETHGVFVVHAFMRSSHFLPKHFTAPVEVKTEAARMDELRRAAMGDMMDPHAITTHYHFDIGKTQKVLDVTPVGKDADTHGFETRGALPKGFHVDPAQRAKDRQSEIDTQKKLAAYLRKQVEAGHPGYHEAALAAERRAASLEKDTAKLAADSSEGWKPFEVRGTYLSKGEDVPSGALDLYGFYKTTRSGDGAKFDLKIRDLSNKIGTDLEFSGDNEHFEDALREAFVKLAKAYPKGTISVLAETLAIDPTMKVTPTGRSLGFELATTSAWKRVKSTVYDPVVQTLEAAAAMAVMVVFPESAAVIVPMLALQDIVANVDDLVAKNERGALKSWKDAGLNLAQIGLDILPAARGAKVLSPARSAIQEAKGMANLRLVAFDALQFAGQSLVMYERTREQLVEIQETQIALMADKFAALIDLEKQGLNPSDPRIVARRAEIERDAKAIRDTVVTTWTDAVTQHATFFVGSHLVGGAPHEQEDSSTLHAPVRGREHDAAREREVPRAIDDATHVSPAPETPPVRASVDEHARGLDDGAWRTGAKDGSAPSAESVAHGTVRMEDHPQFSALINEAETKGFHVVYDNDPRVALVHIVDPGGKLLEVRRELHLTKGMRFLDLEHEMGHLHQLERFGDPPPTEKLVRREDGQLVPATGNLAAGQFTTKQNAVVEYHNRLQEYVRLADRNAPADVLRDHATGLDKWRIDAETAGLSYAKSSLHKWAKSHFPDIPSLEERVRQLGVKLRETTRW